MGKRLRLYVARITDTEIKVGVSINPYNRVRQVGGELLFQTDFMHPQIALDIEYQVKRILSPYWSRANDYEIFRVSAGAILNAVQTAIALETIEGRPNGKIEKRPFQWQVCDGTVQTPAQFQEPEA
jgi:hypothetical protein